LVFSNAASLSQNRPCGAVVKTTALSPEARAWASSAATWRWTSSAGVSSG
jgi:hypothetical protein